MQLFALGLNHHTAPVAIREQVAFRPELLTQALADLVRAKPVKEAAILSTCNRTELYFATEHPQHAADWFAEYHRVALQDLSPYLYTFPSATPSGTSSGWPAGSTRWSSASRRSSAR
jgi:glutamyl-tRNA reductase